MPVVDSFSDRYSVRPPLADVAARRCAVVVVDMVNDFCSPGGAMVLPGAVNLYGPIRRLTAAFRAAGCPVVWVRDEHSSSTDGEFRKRSVHCLKGSWGAQLVPELPPAEGDSVVAKSAYSGFFRTDLDGLLRESDVQAVVLCGVVTNICVRSTAHDAFFLGYDALVVRDACAGTAQREHESSLWDIETHFGRVCTVDELIAWCGRRDRCDPRE